jgi:hypothetical protein
LRDDQTADLTVLRPVGDEGCEAMGVEGALVEGDIMV